MRSRKVAADGFIELWPTVFVQRRLPDHDAFDRQLIGLIEAQERRKADLTTDYLESNLFAVDEPGINWLRTRINETVIEYLRWAGIDYPVKWIVQGWPNVNRFGDYHDYHNHPRAYLSGTYYVKIPTKMAKLKTRGDARPGCITFYDPRSAVNAIAIKKDPYVEPEYTVAPEPGLLLLWPSFVNHFVHPNLSKQTRISISFNIVLKWQDHYLPQQI